MPVFIHLPKLFSIRAPVAWLEQFNIREVFSMPIDGTLAMLSVMFYLLVFQMKLLEYCMKCMTIP